MTSFASEERLNALIDGELAPNDAEELLERMRHDGALRERVCQMRLAKELVRHAYAGIEPHARLAVAGAKPGRWQAAAAIVLFAGGTAAGWLANERSADRTVQPVAEAARPSQGATDHVILHLSSSSPELAHAVLERAQGILEAAQGSGQKVAVEIVANSGGLDLLRAGVSPYAERLAAMRAAHPGLALVACGQTVQRLRESGTDVRLLPGTVTATSALDEIVHRMQQGWAYVRI